MPTWSDPSSLSEAQKARLAKSLQKDHAELRQNQKQKDSLLAPRMPLGALRQKSAQSDTTQALRKSYSANRLLFESLEARAFQNMREKPCKGVSYSQSFHGVVHEALIALGIDSRHEWDSRKSQKGQLDFDCASFKIEIKTKDRLPTPEQAQWASYCISKGVACYLVYPDFVPTRARAFAESFTEVLAFEGLLRILEASE